MALDPTDPLGLWALVEDGVVTDALPRLHIRNFEAGDWRPLYSNEGVIDRTRCLIGDEFTDEVLEDRVIRTFRIVAMTRTLED